MKKDHQVFLAASFLFVITNFIFISNTFAQIYTDDMIEEMFNSKDAKKSHSVMAAQRERLRMMMDGFIIGDSELIKKNATELADAMEEVSRTYTSKLSEGSAASSTVQHIVIEAQLVRKSLANKNYKEAHSHYTQIIASCIDCHQAIRLWGKFETPQSKEDESIEPSSPQSPSDPDSDFDPWKD